MTPHFASLGQVALVGASWSRAIVELRMYGTQGEQLRMAPIARAALEGLEGQHSILLLASALFALLLGATTATAAAAAGAGA